ncbi:MAG: hypothetical protein LBM04_02355 [Opitutaceae bacterium]|jgi:hypothetical protein|nr:hypothetical protein [Opitutaceae bacterium]
MSIRERFELHALNTLQLTPVDTERPVQLTLSLNPLIKDSVKTLQTLIEKPRGLAGVTTRKTGVSVGDIRTKPVKPNRGNAGAPGHAGKFRNTLTVMRSRSRASNFLEKITGNVSARFKGNRTNGHMTKTPNVIKEFRMTNRLSSTVNRLNLLRLDVIGKITKENSVIMGTPSKRAILTTGIKTNLARLNTTPQALEEISKMKRYKTTIQRKMDRGISESNKRIFFIERGFINTTHSPLTRLVKPTPDTPTTRDFESRELCKAFGGCNPEGYLWIAGRPEALPSGQRMITWH